MLPVCYKKMSHSQKLFAQKQTTQASVITEKHKCIHKRQYYLCNSTRRVFIFFFSHLCETLYLWIKFEQHKKNNSYKFFCINYNRFHQTNKMTHKILPYLYNCINYRLCICFLDYNYKYLPVPTIYTLIKWFYFVQNCISI